MGMPPYVLGHSPFPENCITDAMMAIKKASPVKIQYSLFHLFFKCSTNENKKQTNIITHAGITHIFGQPFPVWISSSTSSPAPIIPAMKKIISRILMLAFIPYFTGWAFYTMYCTFQFDAV